MSEVEQIQLDLDYKDNILCFLERQDKPIVSKVKKDKMNEIATKNFDYDFDGSIKFYPYKMPKELINLKFNILCIVGSSGSGKSTFSKYFGEEERLIWDNEKSIISHFDNEEEAIEKLSSVGLNSIPNWLKPRNVLSVGEGFRADLARRIKSNCVIDEYTSTIDRVVAQSCSKSLSKYIRKKGLKKCVFVSCHKDFIDTLCPDYVVDTDDGVVYDTRGLARRKFELQLFEENDKKRIWNIFKQYHYLSEDLNLACKMFSLRLNNEPIAVCCVLPMPNGFVRNGYRIHRLVVLPDYQGLGVGVKLLQIVCDIYHHNEKIMYIRTSHPKLKKYFERSEDWIETARSGTISPSMFSDKQKKDRVAFSYKYIGQKEVYKINFNMIKINKNKPKVELISLF